MLRSFSLLAMAHVVLGDPPRSPLLEVVCGENRTWNAVCDGALENFVPSFLSKTTLTQSECGELANDTGTDYMTVHIIMVMISLQCCIGDYKPIEGLCGKYYPDGSVCASDDKFSNNPIGTCYGLDDFTDNATCSAAGAWDELADQKCDVERIPGLDAQQRKDACEQMSGNWQVERCYFWQVESSRNGFFNKSTACANNTEYNMQLGFLNTMGKECCDDAIPRVWHDCSPPNRCSAIPRSVYDMAVNLGFSPSTCT